MYVCPACCMTLNSDLAKPDMINGFIVSYLSTYKIFWLDYHSYFSFKEPSQHLKSYSAVMKLAQNQISIAGYTTILRFCS